MKKEIETDVGRFVNAMNRGGNGKLAYDDALENIQTSLVDAVLGLGLSNKKTTEVGSIIRSAVANAYKAGFICGANVPGLTQNRFIELMYDRDYKIVGEVIVSDLQELTLPFQM